MTVQELCTRFPEIPADLHEEPILARFAETFGDLLRVELTITANEDESDNYEIKELDRSVTETFRELLRLTYRHLDAKHSFAEKFGVSEDDFLKGVFAHFKDDEIPAAKPL